MNRTTLKHLDRVELASRIKADDLDEADADDDSELLNLINILHCDDIKRAEIVDFAAASTSHFTNATSQGWFTEIAENINLITEPSSPDKDKGDKSPKTYTPKSNERKVPCKVFQQAGSCKFGEGCNFLHGEVRITVKRPLLNQYEPILRKRISPLLRLSLTSHVALLIRKLLSFDSKKLFTIPVDVSRRLNS